MVILIKLPYDPHIPFLRVYPREIKTHVHTGMCMQLFTAVLFITALDQKPARNG
jgi:hypothetical protein